MIIQLVAIAGILFTDLKKTETVIEGEYIPRDEAETAAQSPVVKAGAAVTVASLHKSASPDDLRKKNVIALSALGLASAGFVFQPLNLLSVPLVLYASKDIFKLAWLQLKQGKASVHTLITIITAGIFFIPGGFFLAALVANLFIWSTKLTNTLTAKSRQEIAEIFEKPPEYVWLVMDNLELKTPYEQIKPGDILAVHAGNSIPADGVIVPAVVPDSRKIQKKYGYDLIPHARTGGNQRGRGLFAAFRSSPNHCLEYGGACGWFG